MPYRIDFSKPLTDEVRRIAASQLSNAAELLESPPDGPHDAIHDARRHIKRTRALYRLIASDAKDFTSAANDRLRDIATELSHLRDATAFVESATYLAGEIDSKSLGATIKTMATALEKRREEVAGDESELTETLRIAAAALRDAGAALDGLSLPKHRRKAAGCLAGGWQTIGAKALKALEDCTDTHESVPFHDLRKRAQDRWMHAALLRPLWPSALIAIRTQAKVLVDLLGHEHDLAVLSGHIAASEDLVDSKDKARLLQAIFEQRQKLQQQSRKAAGSVFDQKPGHDAGRIRRLIRQRQA